MPDPLSGAAAVAWSWDGDPGDPEDGSDFAASLFTGGGSKDPLPIEQWAWKNGGGLPDKDNLLHSFAAKYHEPDGGGTPSTYLYFGSDRYDNSGDAQQGFWFLRPEPLHAANLITQLARVRLVLVFFSDRLEGGTDDFDVGVVAHHAPQGPSHASGGGILLSPKGE